ncbi:DUF4013 domain-containing protein [Natrialbaceae archaeon GCM10025810]|uniref:DUF4013 domain-containing protein n=1 Tax=Halovalidus salilacus TaxID=3075124 RepID=UPI00361FE49A
MLGDALSYPAGDEIGRAALRGSVVSVVATAVGVRYAAVLAPSSLAVVPALIALLGVVALLGTATLVLVPGARGSSASVRSALRFGLRSFAVSIGFLLPPIVLLALSVTAMTEGPAVGGSTRVLTLVPSTASILFFAACAYVYPIALAAVASAGRVRAAADADAIVPVATDPAYFLRWTVGFSLVVLATWLVVTTVSRGDAFGLLAAVAAAYLVVAGTRAVGVAYARASTVDNVRSST